jgi:cell division septal protein FtsQ
MCLASLDYNRPMARVELPQSRLRARRKRMRARLALVSLGGLVLLLAAVVGLSYLPFLQVRGVEVSGQKTLATSTIAGYIEGQIAGSYLLIIPKRNIFIYPKRAIADGLLKRFPELRAADVHAANFHTIAADVVEREQKALWCQGEQCYLMDQTGVVYAPAGAQEGFVLYRGHTEGESLPRQYLTPDRFESLFALVDAVSQKVPDSPVETVAVDAQLDAEATLRSGFVLKFALGDAGGDVFERFVLALTSGPFLEHALGDFQYLDLRFGDKLYYKLK